MATITRLRFIVYPYVDYFVVVVLFAYEEVSSMQRKRKLANFSPIKAYVYSRTILKRKVSRMLPEVSSTSTCHSPIS